MNEREIIIEIVNKFKEYINSNCYPLEYCWPENKEEELLIKPLEDICHK